MSPNVQDMILAELKETRNDIRAIWGEIKEIRKDQTLVKVEVEKLKIKAGVWGALAGFLPALGVALWMILKN